MAVATPEDVEVSLRRALHEEEAPYVEKLLARAENLIKVRIPALDALTHQTTAFADLVAHIEAEAVARVLRADNGGIYSSESEDGYSYRLNLKVASGLLDILPEEWARLLGTGGFKSVAPRMNGYTLHRRMNARTRFEHDI